MAMVRIWRNARGIPQNPLLHEKKTGSLKQRAATGKSKIAPTLRK